MQNNQTNPESQHKTTIFDHFYSITNNDLDRVKELIKNPDMGIDFITDIVTTSRDYFNTLIYTYSVFEIKDFSKFNEMQRHQRSSWLALIYLSKFIKPEDIKNGTFKTKWLLYLDSSDIKNFLQKMQSTFSLKLNNDWLLNNASSLSAEFLNILINEEYLKFNQDFIEINYNPIAKSELSDAIEQTYFRKNDPAIEKVIAGQLNKLKTYPEMSIVQKKIYIDAFGKKIKHKSKEEVDILFSSFSNELNDYMDFYFDWIKGREDNLKKLELDFNWFIEQIKQNVFYTSSQDAEESAHYDKIIDEIRELQTKRDEYINQRKNIERDKEQKYINQRKKTERDNNEQEKNKITFINEKHIVVECYNKNPIPVPNEVKINKIIRVTNNQCTPVVYDSDAIIFDEKERCFVFNKFIEHSSHFFGSYGNIGVICISYE